MHGTHSFYFASWPLLRCMACKYFLPVERLPFHPLQKLLILLRTPWFVFAFVAVICCHIRRSRQVWRTPGPSLRSSWGSPGALGVRLVRCTHPSGDPGSAPAQSGLARLVLGNLPGSSPASPYLAGFTEGGAGGGQSGPCPPDLGRAWSWSSLSPGPPWPGLPSWQPRWGLFSASPPTLTPAPHLSPECTCELFLGTNPWAA